MRWAMPVDVDRLPPAARPRISACAEAIGAAHDIADDAARPADDRLRDLARLENETENPEIRGAVQACRKDIATGRIGTWSELVAYATYAARPMAASLRPPDGAGDAEIRSLETYCVAALLLEFVVGCKADYQRHGRVYLPGAWLRQCGADPDDLAASALGPGLRAAIDRVLDRTEDMLRATALSATMIADRDLRNALAREIALRKRLARKLRRRDPLAESVRLGDLDRFAVSIGLWFGRLGPQAMSGTGGSERASR